MNSASARLVGSSYAGRLISRRERQVSFAMSLGPV